MLPILKWIGLSLGVLAAIGVTLTLAGGWILGVAIDVTCAEPPSASCQVRMRALGHLWAVEGNLPRAMTWYERAARAGDVVSMFHLGWAYQEVAEARLVGVAQSIQANGPGTLPNVQAPASESEMAAFNDAGVNAVTWFRASAELGFAPGMNNLGEMYRLGVGVPADPAKAFLWHLRAARGRQSRRGDQRGSRLSRRLGHAGRQNCGSPVGRHRLFEDQSGRPLRTDVRADACLRREDSGRQTCPNTRRRRPGQPCAADPATARAGFTYSDVQADDREGAAARGMRQAPASQGHQAIA